MANDLKLTNGHDIEVANGDISLITEGSEVAQKTKIELLTIEAEWFLDYLIGLPWFDEILRLNTSYDEKISILRNAINIVDGIREVISIGIEFNPDTNSMAVEFEADTDYAPITQRVII
jgi:hypothetical protein